MENCISRLCTGPFMQTIIGGISHLASLAPALTSPRQGYRLQKTSFRILVGIYCHNIHTHTPQSGYHGVTEVAKTANIAKMAKKCINCPTRPTPPHTNPMESGPGNIFSAQNRKKNQKIHVFRPKKRGGRFLTPPPPPPNPPPTAHLPQNLKKSGFQLGGVWGGGRTKNSMGGAFIGQNNDFTRG